MTPTYGCGHEARLSAASLRCSLPDDAGIRDPVRQNGGAREDFFVVRLHRIPPLRHNAAVPPRTYSRQETGHLRSPEARSGGREEKQHQERDDAVFANGGTWRVPRRPPSFLSLRPFVRPSSDGPLKSTWDTSFRPRSLRCRDQRLRDIFLYFTTL